jgi:putative tryptophan/tyrosine transport system substrate-binding protein
VRRLNSSGVLIIRRRFLVGLAVGIVAVPVCGQPIVKPPRIGFLTGEPPPLGLEPFRDGLRRLGYVEGRDIELVVRSAPENSRPEQFAELARDLVRLKVNIIVAGGSEYIGAAQRATTSIPVVMAQTSDAVGSGFVSSLARPGGNITGMSSLTGELGAKRLQLVSQLVVGALRVAVLSNPDNPSHPPQVRGLERAASSVGLKLHIVEARGSQDIPAAFSAMAAASADALLVLPDNSVKPGTGILEIATRAKLPVIWWRREFVEAGGLISYGVDNPGMYRQSAGYVDRILKGAKPGELPVQQPSKLEIFVNLRTASALGLQIPQAVLVLADKVIQ